MSTSNQDSGLLPTDSSTEAVASARVLIVDDVPVLRQTLSILLQAEGYDTDEVETGDAALQALQTTQYDLVLLDIYMPGRDGFEVLEAIRRVHKPNELPVIMVTASEDTGVAVKALECGANDYVTKPVDPFMTMARIQLHLSLKQSQTALRESEERYALVARGTNDGIWDWNLSTNQIYYSPRWLEMLQLESHDSTPEFWFDRIHSEDRARVDSELEAHLSGLSPQFEVELRIRDDEGKFRWMLCRGQAVWDDQGLPHRMAGSLTDITEGKVADALTGLPNRVLFRERLERSLARRKRRPEYKFALLYLDLDNFKSVNDSLGHESGDRLLVAVARRLESSLRITDSMVSRLGGDEFAILLEDISQSSDAIQVANRVLEGIRAPISLGSDREVFASVSIGITVSDDDPENAVGMLQAADTAMYHAKEQGKSCYRLFAPEMKEDASRRLDVSQELRRAIERNELDLHFQPIVELGTSRVTGFEALTRWNHARLGHISPAEFVPLAEESGLMAALGRQVLEKACEQMAEWIVADPRFSDLQISVNLSDRQLGDTEIVDEILAILDGTGLPGTNLRLEITESSIMEDPERGASVLTRLKEHGVKVAVDDFGTGHSSLASIHGLAPDAVKIDRSFIDTLANCPDKQTIVRAIIAVAEGMGLDIVAEGVETITQRDILVGMGCGFAQGYLFSQPLCAEALQAFIYEKTESDAETTSANV